MNEKSFQTFFSVSGNFLPKKMNLIFFPNLETKKRKFCLRKKNLTEKNKKEKIKVKLKQHKNNYNQNV